MHLAFSTAAGDSDGWLRIGPLKIEHRELKIEKAYDLSCTAQGKCKHEREGEGGEGERKREMREEEREEMREEEREEISREREEEGKEEREEENEEEIVDKRGQGRGQGQETVRYRSIGIGV